MNASEDLVEDAGTNGASVVTGGERPETGLPGWFYEPTVLAGERIEGRVADEELFGPVVTVEPFDAEEQAVSLANGSPYALGASVWTTDGARARRVSRALDAGAVWTNDIAYSYYFAQAPWGGRKSSGYGRTHGYAGPSRARQPEVRGRGLRPRARAVVVPVRRRRHRRAEGRARAPLPEDAWRASCAAQLPIAAGWLRLTRRYLGRR